jgi:hypothetical protein
MVARYYNVDPGVVENEWTNIEFLDRAEYMSLQQEIDRQYQKWVEVTK